MSVWHTVHRSPKRIWQKLRAREPLEPGTADGLPLVESNAGVWDGRG